MESLPRSALTLQKPHELEHIELFAWAALVWGNLSVGDDVLVVHLDSGQIADCGEVGEREENHFGGRRGLVVVPDETDVDPAVIHGLLFGRGGTPGQRSADEHFVAILDPFYAKVVRYGTPASNLRVVTTYGLPAHRPAVLGQGVMYDQMCLQNAPSD